MGGPGRTSTRKTFSLGAGEGRPARDGRRGTGRDDLIRSSSLECGGWGGGRVPVHLRSHVPSANFPLSASAWPRGPHSDTSPPPGSFPSPRAQLEGAQTTSGLRVGTGCPAQPGSRPPDPERLGSAGSSRTASPGEAPPARRGYLLSATPGAGGPGRARRRRRWRWWWRVPARSSRVAGPVCAALAAGSAAGSGGRGGVWALPPPAPAPARLPAGPRPLPGCVHAAPAAARAGGARRGCQARPLAADPGQGESGNVRLPAGGLPRVGGRLSAAHCPPPATGTPWMASGRPGLLTLAPGLGSPVQSLECHREFEFYKCGMPTPWLPPPFLFTKYRPCLGASKTDFATLSHRPQQATRRVVEWSRSWTCSWDSLSFPPWPLLSFLCLHFPNL
jgi:hypothetical protein